MFETAVSELKALGVNAEIVSTELPIGRDNVMGVMSGLPNFSWSGTRSTILPGAICENLTSFGGIMNERGGHTPISEFLRYGAAGSSGTIVEPFALDVKFPSPLVHVHYARGCSLAESFYQSLHAPMQLLIIGEPLCRPWADIPQVEVSGVPAEGKVSGTLVLKPSGSVPGGGAIDHFELFADGRRMGTARPGSDLAWDSTRESDGYHELRVVAVAAGPIETQGHKFIPITVDNHQHTIRLAAPGSDRVRWGETLKLTVAAPGMSKLMLVHNARVIGSADGPEAEIGVDPRALGLGPVFVQAVGTNAAKRVWSTPLRVVVEQPVPLPPITKPPANLSRGLVLQLPDGKVMRVDETREPAWLTLKGLRERAVRTAGVFRRGRRGCLPIPTLAWWRRQAGCRRSHALQRPQGQRIHAVRAGGARARTAPTDRLRADR